MRLFGQLADAVSAPEQKEAPPEELDPAPRPPDFADLGGHVAEVLASAEQAAEKMRAEAAEDAARVREEARAHAEAQVKSASDRRAEVEQQVQQRLADAEAQAEARIEAAEQEAREMEARAAERGEELQQETRALERQRDKALWEIRELASQLEEVLTAAPKASTVRAQPFTQYSQPSEVETEVEAPDGGDEDTFVESADGKSG